MPSVTIAPRYEPVPSVTIAPRYEPVPSVTIAPRYEPNANLPHEIDTEDDRVIFIKYVANFMVSDHKIPYTCNRCTVYSENIELLKPYNSIILYPQATKTRIKLNPKKLYMADGYSVQEMLKVVTMLYTAVKSTKDKDINENVTESSFDITNKVRLVICAPRQHNWGYKHLKD